MPRFRVATTSSRAGSSRVAADQAEDGRRYEARTVTKRCPGAPALRQVTVVLGTISLSQPLEFTKSNDKQYNFQE